MNERCVIICFIVLLAVFYSADAQCNSIGDRCLVSGQCDTRYCRGRRCINYGDLSSEIGKHPCNNVACGPLHTCILIERLCTAGLCDPVAQCIRNVCE